jgi:hypothetical protein
VETFLLHTQDWQRLSMSEGTKGPRLFDWTCVPMLHRWEDDGRHWLLIRRSLTDPNEKAYYFVFAPKGTSLPEMVKAIGARWRCSKSERDRSSIASRPWNPPCNHWREDNSLHCRLLGLSKNLLVHGVCRDLCIPLNNSLGLACLP